MTSESEESQIRLRTETLEIGLDRKSGAIVDARSTEGEWRITDRPRLGLSFRLLVPLADRRMNYVEGLEQDPPRVSIAEDARVVSFEWDSVRSQHGGDHPIGVRLRVEAKSRRIVFAVEIDNRSPLVVENVYFPQLGDVRPPSPTRELFAFGYTAGGARRAMLSPHFDNDMGFCMVDSPTFANVKANSLGAVGAPVTPFELLEDGNRGLYIGVDEHSPELVAWHGELFPGWSDSIGHWVPPSDTISGHDVALRFSAVHVPFVSPGERRKLTDIAIEGYEGDWHAGADIYIARRNTWIEEAAPPAWVREPHSWQQIQLTSPEDSLRVPFRDLPEIARECASRGVRAIQVTGWNDGGQDRNNPSHDPDPRLGTLDELKQAIRDCQALGVRIVMFTKFVWADRATERFRSELIGLAVKDPYGDYYNFPGFRYHTMTQLLDINTRRFAPMCFLSDDWIKVCQAEFSKVAELGADGMLHDEALHHSPALLCFETSHGHRLGAPVYARDAEFVDLLRQSVAPDGEYLYGAEACYDWMFETYQLSYGRSIETPHVPLRRYLRPHMPIMVAVTGFDDRSVINQCLLYRYIASYEPFMFKGRLPAMERTIAYGRQMDDLRTELREWFWDGEFRDTVGATVTDLEGKPYESYAVYKSAHDGAPGLVVVNYGHDADVRVRISIDGTPKAYRYRLVDGDEWQAADPHLVIPPRSAATVVPI